MIACFLCDVSQPSINALRIHLRMIHRHDENTEHQCKNGSCFKSVTNWRKFREHLINVHGFNVNAPKKSQPLFRNNDDPEISVNEISPLLPYVSDEPIDLSSEIHSNDAAPSVSDQLAHHALSIVTNWYSKSKLSRKVVQDIVDDTSDLLMSTVDVLGAAVSDKLSELNVDANVILTLNEAIFQNVKSPFQGLGSEYMRLKYLEDNGFYYEPLNFVIGSGLSSVRDIHNDDIALENISCFGKIVQLGKVLKKFFELPGVLDTVLQSLQNRSTNIVTNFVDGLHWRKLKSKFGNKIIVPLFGYFDEFEVDQDLGPHSHMLGAVYITIASLPPEYLGTVENIFLAALFLNEDRKDFGPYVFNKFIDELNSLFNDGIIVSVNGKNQIIYFALGLLCGDNLGLHMMLGFVESFVANYACRFCLVPKTVMHKQSVVDDQMLRTKQNYEANVKKNDVKSTGIKHDSPFHQIDYFHATENPFVDLFHDCLEGVFKYSIRHILNKLMFRFDQGNKKVQHYFTLETLNHKLLTHKYSPGMTNHVGQFSSDVLEKGLKLTGHEMLNFLRIFSILVGEFVPPGDEIWEFYLLIRRITDVITSRALQVGSDVLLKSLIQEHNEDCVRLFDDNLKPKFHHLVHYPQVLRESGPLIYLSVDRFEAKHQPAKEYAKSTKSRRNIAHSIAVKDQLSVASRLFRKEGFFSKCEFGPRLKFTCTPQQILPQDFKQSVCCSFVVVKGTTYKAGVCVVTDIDHTSSLPCFGLIKEVYLNESEEVCLICEEFLTRCFSKHFHAYEVASSKVLLPILLQNLADPLPVFLNTVNNVQ